MMIGLEYSGKISGTSPKSILWNISGYWNIPIFISDIPIAKKMECMEYFGIFQIYQGHTKLPSIWDIGINNFQNVFHMTEEICISVYLLCIHSLLIIY